MSSSKHRIKSSIARYFISINKLDLLNKFIKLLIQAKNNKDNPENTHYSNELINFLNTTTHYITKESQETYINELNALGNHQPQDTWVQSQLETGLYELLKTSLPEVNKFEINYRVLKNIYKLLCAYNLNPDYLNDYLRTAFRNNISQTSGTLPTQEIFNYIGDQAKKNKIEALLFAMNLENLYLFSARPTYQLLPEKERKNKITRFKQFLLLVQEILIDNNFDIQVYNQSTIFKEYFSNLLQQIISSPNDLFQFSQESNQEIIFTLFDRLNFIKILAFVELDKPSYDLVIRELKNDLRANLKNKSYIEVVFKSIVITALDYNLERLAHLLNDLVTEENDSLSSLLVEWVNNYSTTNATKQFLVEVFSELRFDYDEDENEEMPQMINKKLDREFFAEPKRVPVSKKRGLDSSCQSLLQNKKASTESTSLLNINSSSSSRQSQQRSYTIPHSSSAGNVKMFGGTLSRGYKSQPEKLNTVFSSNAKGTPRAESNNNQVKIPEQPSILSKRALNTPHYPVEKKTKLAPTTDLIENEKSVDQIPSYLPSFNLSNNFIEQLPVNTKVIIHARGFHFYQSNIDQKAYYFVTDLQQKGKFKNELDEQSLSDLHSPVVTNLNSPQASTEVLQVVKKLYETPGANLPTKLHYLQEVYSNTFDRLNRTLASSDTFAEYPYQYHPFVSFGDEISHALRYGFGQKITGNRFQDRLRPIYHEDGSLENSFIGQLWITVQSWENYKALDKFHIISEYAKGNIRINDRIINERETSFWVTVSKETIGLRLPLILPSFSEGYQLNYLEAFGINQKQFKMFKEKITQSFKHDNKKNNLQQSLNLVENEIIDHVIEHYHSKIFSNITSVINKKGSTLVYQGLTAEPVMKLPSKIPSKYKH